MLVLVAALFGCVSGGGVDQAQIQTAVKDAFSQANPPGRAGMLLKGHTVWLEGWMLEPECLEKKELAFNDDPDRSAPAANAKISPTYLNQWTIVAHTPTGYCVPLGKDPTVSVGEFRREGSNYTGEITISVSEPTPWFECLSDVYKTRRIDVAMENGQPKVVTDVSLFQGDCPSPLPEPAPRKAGAAPTAAPPGAPSKADVQALASAFDEALYKGDFAGALDLVSCYNLFEESKYGSCSPAEILPHGPVAKGQGRPQDGMPWLENAISDFGEIGKISRDSKDPTMYHVQVKHHRTGADRSFSVQWADGRWKLLGVVSAKSESLTSARILNDLHKPQMRDIFARRLAGERIDEKGLPLEEEPEQGG